MNWIKEKMLKEAKKKASNEFTSLYAIKDHSYSEGFYKGFIEGVEYLINQGYVFTAYDVEYAIKQTKNEKV